MIVSCGKITDDANSPISNTKIFYLLQGIFIIDSSLTDVNGDFTKNLPKGDYIVAAEREGYRTTFYGGSPDPFFARPVRVDSGINYECNISLQPIENNSFYITGRMIDSLNNNIVNKGVVIIRKGTHTPTLLKPYLQTDSSAYTGFVKSDGSFKILVEDSSYYFVQGFSEYYLPTYFNYRGNASVFWQQADSLFVNQGIFEKNLYVVRDSSYGGEQHRQDQTDKKQNNRTSYGLFHFQYTPRGLFRARRSCRTRAYSVHHADNLSKRECGGTYSIPATNSTSSARCASVKG